VSWLKALLIGGGAVLTGGVIYVVATSDDDDVRAVVAATDRAVTAAVKKGRQIVTELITGIKQGQIDNIIKYGIADHLETYRGRVPWATGATMIEHESAATFDPYIYNYYPVVNGVKAARATPGAARATPGAPLVTVWRQAGDGGCEHDPHACGLGQILDNIRINPPKGQPFNYAGVPLPYLNDLFDAATNIHAIMAGAQHNAAAIAAAGVTDPTLMGLLIYLAHAEGLGVLTGGKYPGAFAMLKQLGKALTWANLVALPWGTAGFWTIHNSLSGVARTIARTSIWAAAEAQLKGTPAVAGSDDPAAGRADRGAPVPGLDTQPIIDALLVEVQQAELARDLVTAADRRAQLDALTGGGDGSL
jgi:hypothetical protein